MNLTRELIFGWRETNSCVHNLARLSLRIDRGEQVFDQTASVVFEASRNDRDDLN
ncbi:hypothetical protein RHMOL_Rhmol01G0336700 [Rhododendron molle]|uniref:Uncharacterized protein n=1 Tax=Rhododendron molle TaxID=49168 RepID=A0ACC0QBV0_RHOML|nr:hypothetical protein RHMOL_Rhmol01G0336700 [Rhododendron molle]